MTQAAHVDPNEGRFLIREAVQFLAIPCGLDEFPRGLQREYQDQSDEAWIGFRRNRQRRFAGYLEDDANRPGRCFSGSYLRQLLASQGSCGARQWNAARPAGEGDAAVRSYEPTLRKP